MDIGIAVGSFFVCALGLPSIRHRIRTGEWGVVVHRATDPLQVFVGRAFGGALVGVAAWTGALLTFGPEALSVASPPRAVAAVGWGVYAASLGVVMGAQATMGPSWRVGIDQRPTDLVASGVYRWVRHPIYAGMGGLAASLALIAPSPWTLLAVPLVAFPMGVQARLEERHLEDLHGEAWRRYAASTGRFLPRWTAR